MAGPTASVIVPKVLDEREVLRIAGIIEETADRVDGRDFAVSGHPFSWTQGEEYDGEFSECDYSTTLGWRTKDQIILIAMCNQSEDHAILADLCIKVSEQIGGLIDFGGILQLSDRAVSGCLHRIEFESSHGGTGYCHIGDIEFLKGWISQPEFRMVK